MSEINNSEGNHHGTIIRAIVRKLVYRIFIILKDNVPYQCITKPTIHNRLRYRYKNCSSMLSLPITINL